MNLNSSQRLSRESIRAALASSDDTASWQSAVQNLLTRGGSKFDLAAGEALAEAFEQRLFEDSAASSRPAWRQWIDSQELDSSPLARWFHARVLTILGDSEAALTAWDACLSSLPQLEPEGLLYRAKLLWKTGQPARAAADLRLALQQPNDFSFWQRAEKLIRKILPAHPELAARPLKLAVLSGCGTTTLLAPLLSAACFRDGIRAELYSGDYDHYRQDILDPQSELYRFAPEIVLCCTHWRDAHLPEFAEDPESAIAAVVQEQVALWRELRSRSAAEVVAFTFDQPRVASYGRLSEQLPGGRVAMLREVNRRLSEAASELGVVLIDLESLAAEVGGAAWADSREWYMAKLHPASAGLPVLVEGIAATLRAMLGLGKKVLALDLDNTLWGGVIGEDGLEGIQLGSTSPVGEAYRDFQQFVRELTQRGVLLVVCSKNNEADARLPFESHPDCVLKLDDFAGFLANWNDKASNLRQLAQTLSLGLDSFVFCDDNPVERAWVRAQLPEVAVPEMPQDPAGYLGTLARGRWFESIALSEEDRQRHQQYQANAQRSQFEQTSGTLESFLEGLQMSAQCGPIGTADLPRVTQLVNKTNQFNVTTRRYTEAQLATQAADPNWWTSWYRLQDRFGEHGLVGLLTCRPREGETDALEIDNWLMSCRVLGRTLESLMLRRTIEMCRERGISKLYGRYLPTAKNAQVANLFEKYGFRDLEETGQQWVLEIAEAELPTVYIETVEDPA